MPTARVLITLCVNWSYSYSIFEENNGSHECSISLKYIVSI